MKQAEHSRYKVQPDPRNNHHSKAIPSFSNDFLVTNQEAQNFAREKKMMKRIKQDEYKSSLDAQLKSKSRMEEQSKYGKVQQVQKEKRKSTELRSRSSETAKAHRG
eukprot:TRINITY_DN921_c0_g1_i1.p1 TRINITY_DN921_c0_g1~~TRINITY_DN921_c0_g1_i1.p1  ORF type:complete len:106 (+),score=41.53 TRINITY_DN921_c0_g1_i1:822-1139(+)